MDSEDLYKILEVSRDASDAEIKKSYRRLARELHPDRNRNDKVSEERFKKVSAAYAVLSDKKKKELYDKYGVDGLRDGFDPNMWNQYGGYHGGWPGPGAHAYGSNGEFDFGGFSGFGALEDIFENLFGGGMGKRGRTGRAAGTRWNVAQGGAQVKSTLEVELMDVVLGRELQIAIPIKGKRKSLKVKIPKGIESGKTIRLKGQGEESPNGGPSGDLLLEIMVKKDASYQRDGLDLTKKQNITIGQAYNGAVIPVETPWGSIKVTIPKGAQGGQRLRIKEKGMERGSKKGDLYIVLNITIPKSRSKRTKEAVAKLEEMYEEG